MTKLPEIQIKEVTDVTYSNIEMDVPDDVYSKIVSIGEAEATESDYFKIGFLSILKESLTTDEGK
mgnify:FL=1